MGVYVNLYHNSELNWHLEDGTALRLAQSTNYPWNGDVKMTVTPRPPRPIYGLRALARLGLGRRRARQWPTRPGSQFQARNVCSARENVESGRYDKC